MQRTEGDLTATLDEYWPLISHIQVAYVPGRHEPGTGETSCPFVLDHLDRKRYPGGVGLEYHPSTGCTMAPFTVHGDSTGAAAFPDHLLDATLVYWIVRTSAAMGRDVPNVPNVPEQVVIGRAVRRAPLRAIRTAGHG